MEPSKIFDVVKMLIRIENQIKKPGVRITVETYNGPWNDEIMARFSFKWYATRLEQYNIVLNETMLTYMTDAELEHMLTMNVNNGIEEGDTQ